MKDPTEKKLQPTRHRSLAGVRHKFEFYDDNHRAIFPIVKRDETGTLSLYGTGFFIAPGGVIATAKHLFEGKDVSPEDAFEILQEGEDHVEARQLSKVVIDKDTDVAIGILGAPHNACLSCNEHPVVGTMLLDPEIYEVVGSYVFSQTLIDEPETVEFDDGPDQAQAVKYRSHWELGLAEEIYPEGLGFSKGQCFRTSIFLEGRGSGGPLFNSNGFVVGINSRGLAEDEGLPYSIATSIREIFKVEIDGKSIAKLRSELSNKRIAHHIPLIKRTEAGTN